MLREAVKQTQWQKSYLDRLVQHKVLKEQDLKDGTKAYVLTEQGLPHVARWIENEENYGGNEFAWFVLPSGNEAPVLDGEEDGEGEVDEDLVEEFKEAGSGERNFRVIMGAMMSFERKLEEVSSELSRGQRVQEDILGKLKKKVGDLEKNNERMVSRVGDVIRSAKDETKDDKKVNDNLLALMGQMETETKERVEQLSHKVDELIQQSKKEEERNKLVLLDALNMLIESQKNGIASFEIMLEQIKENKLKL